MLHITVVGMGYVGMSMAVLLAQKHNVTCVDIIHDLTVEVNIQNKPHNCTTQFMLPNLSPFGADCCIGQRSCKRGNFC